MNMEYNCFFIASLLHATVVASAGPCCSGTQNVVEKGKCLDGTNITGIECSTRFLLDKDEDPFEEIGNQLLFQGNVFESGRYCFSTKFVDETPKDVALICFEDTMQEHHPIWYSMIASCEIISVIAIILTIQVYFLVPSLLDVQGKSILHSISALAGAMFFLALLQLQIDLPDWLCVLSGYATFVLFLSAFAWLNTIAFHIWKTAILTGSNTILKTPYIFYNIYGYGVPFCILIAAIISQNIEGGHVKPNIDEQCFFNGTEATWTFFYGPMAILLAINIFFYVWTIKKLWKDIKQASCSSSRLKSLRYRCLMCVKLFFIMGLTWIFEVVSFAFKNQSEILDYVWLITDFLNALQGVLILLVLVVFRKKALKGLSKTRTRCLRFPEKWKTLEDDEGESRTGIEEENLSEHPVEKTEEKV